VPGLPAFTSAKVVGLPVRAPSYDLKQPGEGLGIDILTDTMP
jgi:hypothetical protein